MDVQTPLGRIALRASALVVGAVAVAAANALVPEHVNLVLTAVLVVVAAVAVLGTGDRVAETAPPAESWLHGRSTFRVAMVVVAGYATAAIGLAIPGAIDIRGVQLVVVAALAIAVLGTVLLCALAWARR